MRLQRTAAAALAAGRVAIGLGLLVAPATIGRIWIGRDADRRSVQVLVRAFGARDVVLGAGALLAMRHGRGLRGWVEAGAVADAADALATLAARDELPDLGSATTVVLAGSAAVTGAWAARAIGHDAPPATDETDGGPAWRPHTPGHPERR